MQAFITTKEHQANGTIETKSVSEVPIKVEMMPHHKTGRSWTATGYGARIPTVYMVQFHGKWRRVYAICYSNASTLFIGKRYDQTAIVDILS